MKYRLRFTFLLIGLFSMCHAASALELYVALDGSHAHRGTAEAPLASMIGARDALRASGRLGKEPCTVIIEEGVYRFGAPARFGPADSGSGKAPVVYRAAEGAMVVFTGAQPIPDPWEPWQNGIYRAQVGKMAAIDQLFLNGKRQHMARYPNVGAGFVPVGKDRSTRGKKAGTVPFNGSTPDAWDAGKAEEWADPTGAFMHGMHGGLWGSQHYRVLGKKGNGELLFEGGWQNNRSRSAHPGYRMIENVFEELDAPGEWYHDVRGGWLYYNPAKDVDMTSATFEAVFQLKHLIEFYGETKEPVAVMEIPDSGNGLPMTTVKTHETSKPVQHIRLEGIRFGGTARTFMDTIEPLLRSDWTIYRGGALHLRGTEHIVIENCAFEELGGNAVFVDGYNRGAVIRGNRFRDNGASDVNVVGSPAAVRDPTFSFGASARPLETIDTLVGPKTEDYPADCLVEDNLMTRCGRFEKQVAGVNMSMSSRITVRHNTISHTPRAAINVCDGTWGGHLIEWNDCFETVLETHDHGAFNGWGRDRIWHSAMPAGPNQRDEDGKPLISYYVEQYPESPRWDAYQTTIVRHNRMHCEHGWDIDLDDGCSNYELYNNLCLSGGLKTREGYYRVVTNNVLIGGGYTCNVPYPKPTHDVFERNVLWGKRVYNSSNPRLWGGTRNHNFVHHPDATNTVPASALQQETMDDAGSLYGDADFVAPQEGNFQVAPDSPALKTGFKNFSMGGFGVTSPALKVSAASPPIDLPAKAALNVYNKAPARNVLGATVKTLDTDAEVTATGMQETVGTYLVDVPAESAMAQYGFKSGDVVLFVDGMFTPGMHDFSRIMSKLKTGSHQAKVWRAQETHTFHFAK